MARLRRRLDQWRPWAALRQRGQGLVEYGLIISVVSIAAVALIMLMGPRVASMFNSAGASLSDRRRKSNFVAVDVRAVLARVVALPIQTWNYLSDVPSVRHIGPMAQDFHGAFGVGEDDTRINHVDASGVTLAAIQGLHQLVSEQEVRLGTLEARVAALEAQDAKTAERQLTAVAN